MERQRQYRLHDADRVSETCGIVHPIDDHCQEMFKQLGVFNLRPALRKGGEKCVGKLQGRIRGLKIAPDIVFTIAFSMIYEILDTHQALFVMW